MQIYRCIIYTCSAYALWRSSTKCQTDHLDKNWLWFLLLSGESHSAWAQVGQTHGAQSKSINTRQHARWLVYWETRLWGQWFVVFTVAKLGCGLLDMIGICHEIVRRRKPCFHVSQRQNFPCKTKIKPKCSSKLKLIARILIWPHLKCQYAGTRRNAKTIVTSCRPPSSVFDTGWTPSSEHSGGSIGWSWSKFYIIPLITRKSICKV